MPCNTVNTSEVNLTGAVPELVAAALVKLGFAINTRNAETITATHRTNYDFIRWTKGQNATITGNYTTTQALTQAYSSAAVEYAAKKNGWQLKQTSANKYEAIRR